MPKPPLKLKTTTLWEYPSQNYGPGAQGSTAYEGATPSYVIWNVLQRYTRPGDLVVDPMGGSGTTLDVARDSNRRALAYDIAPAREGVFRADARHLPLESEKVDFVFVDPPYGDNLRYSGLPECIGELPADGEEYYREMDRVFQEIHRVLKPGHYFALYVCDAYKKGKPFIPIGFSLFNTAVRYFVPVDSIAVVRHNATLKRNHWHTAAIEGNYFLRGFNHLMLFLKPPRRLPRRAESLTLPDLRDAEEVKAHVEARGPLHAPFGQPRAEEPSHPQPRGDNPSRGGRPLHRKPRRGQ
jgi:SAM-dependent methyltransferase